jgi:hypothetical protein
VASFSGVASASDSSVADTGYDAGATSRVENGRRPPTELFARVCDQAFPGRDRWFSEFFSESRLAGHAVMVP